MLKCAAGCSFAKESALPVFCLRSFSFNLVYGLGVSIVCFSFFFRPLLRRTRLVGVLSEWPALVSLLSWLAQDLYLTITMTITPLQRLLPWPLRIYTAPQTVACLPYGKDA